MSAVASPAPVVERSGPPPGTVVVGIAAFAVVELALALFMAVTPHAFYTAVGPFAPYNRHYVRDVASFEAALGAGLLIALRRRSWRVPMLGVMTIQYGLHSLNHLIDIGRAHPVWLGYFDFFSLAAATAVLAWLWHSAAREAPTPGEVDAPVAHVAAGGDIRAAAADEGPAPGDEHLSRTQGSVT